MVRCELKKFQRAEAPTYSSSPVIHNLLCHQLAWHRWLLEKWHYESRHFCSEAHGTGIHQVHFGHKTYQDYQKSKALITSHLHSSVLFLQKYNSLVAGLAVSTKDCQCLTMLRFKKKEKTPPNATVRSISFLSTSETSFPAVELKAAVSQQFQPSQTREINTSETSSHTSWGSVF